MNERQLVQWASRASVVLALFLIAIHIPAYALTGSMAVFSSLMESTADAVASVVTFVAVRVSQQPHDSTHRFGYGKAESLGSLVLCGFITLTGLVVIKDSLIRVWDPQPITHEHLVYWLSGVAMAATFALVGFQHWVLRRSNNQVILADHIHYKGHLLAYGSMVLGALAGQLMGWHWADAVAGIVISLLMISQMWPVAREAYFVLMDRELATPLRDAISHVVKTHEHGASMHGLKTRQSGDTLFVQFHLELPCCLTLAQAHQRGHSVVDAVRQQWPHADVIVHMEPAGVGPHYGG
jgi:ferrous-iron efflux pump FieF